jgi:acetyltransferase-like isoleucine patch superfamily enzyme
MGILKIFINYIRQLVYYLYRYPSLAIVMLFSKAKGWLYSGHIDVTIGIHSFIGRNVKISNKVTIGDYARLIGAPRVTLGENVYINSFSMALGDVIIEKNVLIGPHVVIWSRDHTFDDRNKLIWNQHEKSQQSYNSARIVIKEGAWLAANVVILKGVTIGKGAVIGAGSVVTKDIPDYGVAFGAPATVRYYRN